MALKSPILRGMGSSRRVHEAFERLEAQLRSLAEISSIAGPSQVAAHEIRNILTPVLGNLDLARHRHDDPHLERARAGLMRAITTLELLSGKLETSTLDRSTNLSALVTDVLSDLEVEFERAKVQVERSLRVESLVDISPIDARHILTNILRNAVQAMPKGGTVHVQTSSEGQEVAITISDTGCGMGPDAKAVLLGRKPKKLNRGIGLRVVRHLVAAARGSIHVSSRRGRGTKIQILLPMVEAGANSATWNTASAA
ncbi:MAG: HAMP domain-containing sensor histidine kinase [Planctomycetota bacterium]|nr:HAMP domain-containing sensor histidine kinase [Planctomycetota bacterium]